MPDYQVFRFGETWFQALLHVYTSHISFLYTTIIQAYFAFAKKVETRVSLVRECCRCTLHRVINISVFIIAVITGNIMAFSILLGSCALFVNCIGQLIFKDEY